MRVFMICVVLAIMFSGTCLAEEYELSSNARFVEAKSSFEKGLEYIEKGDREARTRPGLAQKLYEHAEDYILKAQFLYKELGHKYGIDVNNEISICDKVYRETHVKVNDARKKARHR